MPDVPDDQRGDELSSTDLAAVRTAMDGLRDSSRPSAPGNFKPHFPDLESWVHEYFVLVFGRPGQARWCARWWDHPEAVLRLDVLWSTWEVAGLDPVHGTAAWVRDHLDPNLAALYAPDGPFGACTEDEHVPQPVLPVEPAPDGFGSPVRHWWDVLGEPDR